MEYFYERSTVGTVSITIAHNVENDGVLSSRIYGYGASLLNFVISSSSRSSGRRVNPLQCRGNYSANMKLVH